MIRRLELTNYGPFARAELDLAPLTVIVGPNASGKSKLLEIVHFIGSQHDAVSVNQFLWRRQRKGAEEQSVAVCLETDDGSRITWQSDEDSDPATTGRFLDPRTRPKLQTSFLKLHPDTLRSPSYIDSDEPLMREDGYGLATTLAYLNSMKESPSITS